MEGLWGPALPDGPGPPTRGTGSSTEVVVGAFGGFVGQRCSQRTRPNSWGDGVLPRRQMVPMEGLRGPVVPYGSSSATGGTGSLAEAAIGAYGGPAEDGCFQRRRSTSWGDTESFPKAVVAYGGPAKDGGAQRPGPASWGDAESCPGGTWCLWRAYGGRQFPTVWAPQLGGRGALPRRRSVPMEGFLGMAVPNGPGPPASGTGSTA